MKKLLLSFVLLLTVAASAICQPKYVFYFIGDGMGLNQIHLTETYLASVQGKLGIEKLQFTQFPVATYATSYSNSGNTTDSAAAGTALATGTKTDNGKIGVDPDGKRLENLSDLAKRSGKRVAVLTTTAINHATPGAFGGHQNDRNMYYEISEDMIATGADFYAGSKIYREELYFDDSAASPIRPKFEAAGYTICGNLDEFQKKAPSSKKMLLVPGKGYGMRYRIDYNSLSAEKQERTILLKDLVGAAIEYMMKEPNKGFFIMTEGGEIDHACHSNDAASSVFEVIDFDEAIQVALEFYKKHPKQTLIVVAADHETGGLTFNPGKPSSIARLQNQTKGVNAISYEMKEMMNSRNDVLSWEETKAFLSENFGLWSEMPVSWPQEKELRDIYEATIAKKEAGSAKDLYSDLSSIVSAAMKIFNEKCNVYWSTKGHSAGYVPVFAIGNGAEMFEGKKDNTDIPKTIRRVAAYK